MESNNVHLFLEKYFPMASFIASIVGPKCEVVVHDISNPERSIVHIENGHISGRKVGDGSTDLVLKLLKGGAYHEQQFITNYKGKGSLGQIFRSSTYFIKDESGVLVGMMCLNIDVTHLDTAAQWIQDLLEGGGAFPSDPKVPVVTAAEKPVSEYLQGNMDDLLAHMIETVMSRTTVSPNRLSAQEKMELIKEFNDEGVFLLKGGVVQVAKACNMSEPTVYRYLQKVKD
ncbi:helix-turn-helix transcriptional regulator [Paenibacillus sp. IHBB 10380]|uniref:helix-turn-helix transcriptional regulator n=1 Tax=Paenibacillus sp. IHBB 10380 TaxID=1566358 RepID=UPI0005CFD2E3|nr:PAS domain-containing protein [Paenibacillus sp. IHBB 10380]AJS59077.1 hypothetical protein UB51_12105 [Paenibacillus sp. IHBB 10380]